MGSQTIILYGVELKGCATIFGVDLVRHMQAAQAPIKHPLGQTNMYDQSRFTWTGMHLNRQHGNHNFSANYRKMLCFVTFHTMTDASEKIVSLLDGSLFSLFYSRLLREGNNYSNGENLATLQLIWEGI